MDEPDIETAARMLRSLVPGLQKHHGVHILEEAIQQATILSNRYMMGRLLPDKSISVLDTACSRVSSQQVTTPAPIEQLEKLICQLSLELQQLKREEKQGISHAERLKELENQINEKTAQLTELKSQWEAEKAIIQEILILSAKASKMQFQSLLLKLQKIQGDAPLMEPYVDAQSVAGVIADWTGIPLGQMLKDEAKRMSQLDRVLKARVVGQSEGLSQIADTIKISSAKLGDPNKPLGVFLLIGPSGVGKTETAMALAEEIFGSEDKMTVINMTEFKEAHKISLLAGSPPGYVGYGEGGVLTEAVRRKPYSLILLDEMEKAHPSIQDFFYQVFDKGVMKDAQGRDINFKNTLIIMTANTPEEDLSKTFKPAFLGRVRVIPYLPLSESGLKKIIQLKLQKIQVRVQQQYQVQLVYTPEIEEEILNACQQQNIGARQIDQMLSNEVLPVLSRYFLDGLFKPKSRKRSGPKTVELCIESGQILCVTKV